MSGTNNWRAVFIAGLDARANIAIREEGMKPMFAILIALVICGTAAALEGVCAGKKREVIFRDSAVSALLCAPEGCGQL